MSTAIKHPVPDRVKPSFVIFDMRADCQSARSGTGCFIAVPMIPYGKNGHQKVNTTCRWETKW